MRLIWIVIPLILIGLIGMQESFADSSDKVCGDKLCQDPPPRTCTEEDHRKPLIPPLTRGLIGPHPRIMDYQGNSIDDVIVDQQIGILVGLANGKDCNQPFVLIIQISDMQDNSVVALEWISGVMMSGTGQSPMILWMPEYKGEYKIQTFVWYSLEDLFILYPSATTSLRVDADNSKISLDVDANPESCPMSVSSKCFTGIVTKIIDGDTIHVNDGSIRFALASDPELTSE